jgi:hypothetical protein
MKKRNKTPKHICKWFTKTSGIGFSSSILATFKRTITWIYMELTIILRYIPLSNYRPYHYWGTLLIVNSLGNWINQKKTGRLTNSCWCSAYINLHVGDFKFQGSCNNKLNYIKTLSKNPIINPRCWVRNDKLLDNGQCAPSMWSGAQSQTLLAKPRGADRKL